MNYKKSSTLSVFVSCLAVSGLLTAKADTVETTTVKTTTTSTSPADLSTAAVVETSPFMLSAGVTYVVVDPLSGAIQGVYDPATKLFNGQPLTSGVLIVEKSSGKVVAMVDITHNLVDVNIVPATDSLLISIDTRRRELDRQISEALNKGYINAAQAAALRAELDHITTEEAIAREHGVFPYRKALVLASNLDMLSDRVVPVLRVATTMPPVIPPEFVTINEQVTFVDAITARKMRLQRRIDDEYQAGRLSGQNVAKLKEQFNQISLLETKHRKDGMLSDSSTRTLNIKLDQLQSSMDSDIAQINKKRAEIGIIVN